MIGKVFFFFSSIDKFFKYANKLIFLNESISVLVHALNKVPDFLFWCSFGFAKLIKNIVHKLSDFLHVQGAGIIHIILFVDHVDHGPKFFFGDLARGSEYFLIVFFLIFINLSDKYFDLKVKVRINVRIHKGIN